MIGRADIEGSKSEVDLNSYPPQASYPCGNFSDTSEYTHDTYEGSLGNTFVVVSSPEGSNQAGLYPYVQEEVSDFPEPTFWHGCYRFTHVPPQPNCPKDLVPGVPWAREAPVARESAAQTAARHVTR